MSAPDWIAADWGTSHLRLWMMQGDAPVRRIDDPRGMSKLSPDGYEAVLLELLGDSLTGPTDVIICGMAVGRRMADTDEPLPGTAKDQSGSHGAWPASPFL